MRGTREGDAALRKELHGDLNGVGVLGLDALREVVHALDGVDGVVAKSGLALGLDGNLLHGGLILTGASGLIVVMSEGDTDRRLRLSVGKKERGVPG